MKKSFLVLLAAISLVSLGWAKFTLEQVMSSPFPSQLTAAGEGERIAWVFYNQGASNVWVADGPLFAARQVTHYTGDDGMPIASLRLTPDGHIAVYARGSETNRDKEVADPANRAQEPKQQVWAIDIDRPGQPRLLGDMGCDEEGCEDIQVSPDGQWAVWAARKQLWLAPVSGAQPAKQLFWARGDNFQPRWSPDGKKIAFTSAREDHSFVGIYELGSDAVRYLAPSTDRDSLPRWSPDGKRIAFVRAPGVEAKRPLIPVQPAPWAIWIADPDGGAAREIWHSGAGENDSLPRLYIAASFNFAADRIVFDSEADGRNHLYSLPLAGGAPALLTPGDFDVEDVRLSSDRKSLVYTSNQDDVDRRHLWRVNVGDGAPPHALTAGETIEWDPVMTGDRRFLLCLGSSATSPAMPYLVTAQGRRMLAQDALPADFPSAELVPPKPVIFSSDDGFTIHGQLFVPRNLPAGVRVPAVIFTHGGPIRQMVLGFHYMGYYHNAYAENQYLANLGYVVLSVNYRRGTMYGRAFREPKDAGWRGASEYRDLLAGAHYLQSLPYVDAKKIGLWGGSYGGYLTAMGLARNSDLFAAGVDLHGVHDWSVFFGKTRAGRYFAGELAQAPDLGAAEKLAFESSPNAAIATWRSPVLLVQGDDDRNVPFSQTVDLAQRLRQHGVRFEQLVFPDEIHDFLLWSSWVKAYQAAADFFDRTLKAGPGPPGGKK